MGTVLPFRRLRHGPPRRLPAPHDLRKRRSPVTGLRRYFGFIALAGVFGFAVVFGMQDRVLFRQSMAIEQPTADTRAPAALTGYPSVVDGDTLRLAGKRIRLVGMDAPELHQTCRDASGHAWPCGRAARERMAALVSAGRVDCAPRGRGYYGRTLARCLVNGVDIGAAMVREGYAVNYGGYWLAEAGARLHQRGLWAGAFERPKDWRRKHRWH